MEIERKFLVPCLPEAMTPIPSTRLNRPICKRNQWSASVRRMTASILPTRARDSCPGGIQPPLTWEAYAHLLPKADGVVLTKNAISSRWMAQTI